MTWSFTDGNKNKVSEHEKMKEPGTVSRYMLGKSSRHSSLLMYFMALAKTSRRMMRMTAAIVGAENG